MRKFRSFFSLLLVAASIHYASAPFNYLYALEVERAKEQRVRDIAAKLNVDPEFLLNPQGRKRFDFKGIFDSIEKALGLGKTATATSQQPLDIKASIAQVKSRYALVAADTTLAKIAEALDVDLAKTKNRGQLKAHLNSIVRLIDKDFLPAVPEGVPGAAKSRDAQMRSAINKLRNDVKNILKDKDALEEANLETTLSRLRSAVGGELTTRKGKGPRWTKDPFPVKDAYKEAPKRQLGSGERPTTNPVSAVVTETSAARLGQTTNAITVPAEVAALAAQLATPAKIFAWVHDNIEFEPYSGVAKGSLGTLQEKSGNDWDQAVLLRDMLHSRGFTSQLEWGTVTLPMARAMNIAGTEDPTQAANLLATAGFEGIVLMTGNVPVGVQVSHAWVRSHIPYIPNRGATVGTADTWVRMDPSFKRYEYQKGIKINGKVAWNENEYLNTSAIRPPADFYGDKIWAYIRANNIDCINLSQVTKAGRIKQQNFPYVPSTLTSKIDAVGGTAVDVPANQMQSVGITIMRGASTVASFSTSVAATWGKKVTIGFAPATPDDAATIAAYGGLFNTPAYLVRLKPQLMFDDVVMQEGAAVDAGAELDLNLVFTQPNVAPDTAHHDMIAGELHTLVFDAGNPPDSLIEARMNRLKALTNEDQILSEKLYLVGLRYMQHVDDGIDFAAGVRWQRPVKRVFEADVRRQIDVTYNFAGAPLRLIPAENNIDVARLVVGIVPIDNDLSNRAEALALAGLESSYREGSIWEEMQSERGISAAKALLLARINGQQIQTVTSANVDAVLASANLSADVEAEIRGAVGQGRIAKMTLNNVSLGRWTGTGYILQDPATGAATYPISGGLAGGSTVDEVTESILDLLGSEPWLEGDPFGEFLRGILGVIEGMRPSERPSTRQSDPINIATGNMYKTVSDVTVSGRGLPVAISRTYNSRSTVNGHFGYGWTFNYDEHVGLNPDGSATYRESDGSEHTFVRAADGSFVSPAGKYMQLTRTTSEWTLRFKDGMFFTFDDGGRVIGQTDTNGNTVTIDRNATGDPVAIIDAGGRTVLTFTVVNGRITQITDIDDRKTTYAYNGDDLVAVTDSAAKTVTMAYDTGHNMTEWRDPAGNAQMYDYDSDDRLFHHVDAMGAEEFFHYDVAGRQSVVTDKRGGDRFISFDDRGRATAEADPAGNVVAATFDEQNNRTAVVDSRGKATLYEYDSLGNVAKQTDPDGAVVTTTYDASSRPLTTTDALGVTTTSTFDGSGNLLTRSTNVGGVVTTITNTYNSSGQMLTSVDANGATTSMTWSANGMIATRTDPANNVTTIASDDMGRITGFTDPAGNTTALTFDGRDRVLSMKDPYGATTTFTYDDAGRRAQMVTPAGTTRYTYDGEGRVLTTTDPQGNVTRNVYDAAGDLIARTDARGNTTRYEYDIAGRVTKMIDANGGVWSYAYCGAVGGNGCAACSGGSPSFCEVTDPSGNVIRREFDAMGRVTLVTDSLGHATFTEYDKAGRKVAETDAQGNKTTYGYDERGKLLFVREANGAVTQYTYDKNGNKLTQKDPNGRVWSFKYDSLNRLIEERNPLDRVSTYAYDALGNVRTKTDPKNQVTTYEYAVSRLTKTTFSTGGTETHSYDAVGRRTQTAGAQATTAYDYDAMNRIIATRNLTYGTNANISYSYDAAGNRRTMTTVRGTVTYTYDAKNRLVQIDDPNFGAFRLAYDAMDRRTELRYPNGAVTTYAYDKGYRMTAVATKDSGGALVDAWSYQYDAVGNRISKTDATGKSETYKYDAVYRLTEANYADATFEKFTYDGAGNRKSLTNATGTINYTYDVANQLLSAGADTFTYDLNGNVASKTVAGATTNFTYDAENQVATITGAATETNRYDVDGRRTQITSSAVEGEIRPQYDLAGNPVVDLGNDNTVWVYRLYGPGIDEPLAEFWRVKNRTIYLHRDALGSVTAATAPDGKLAYSLAYTAFGKQSRSANPTNAPWTRLGFTSRENSVGSLAQYRSRYYDTHYGRFLQQDSYRGSDLIPPSLHRYTYVHNNPIRYTDPTGHWIILVALAAAALGVIIGLTIGSLMTDVSWPSMENFLIKFWTAVYWVALVIAWTAIAIVGVIVAILAMIAFIVISVLVALVGAVWALLIGAGMLLCVAALKFYDYFFHMTWIPDEEALYYFRACVSAYVPGYEETWD